MEYVEMPVWAVALQEQTQAVNQKLDLVLESLNKDEEETVGTEVAGKILGVSQRTVQEWERQGKMPKKISKPNEKHRWNKKAIQRMANGENKGGRKRLETS